CEKILGAVWNAVERPAVAAGGNLPLGPLRLGHGAVARDGHDGVVLGPDLLESIEERLGERDRRDCSRAHELREATDREEYGTSAHVRPRSGTKGGNGSSVLSSFTARSARAASTIPSTPFLTSSSWACVRRSP